jgi:hypothetical protein
VHGSTHEIHRVNGSARRDIAARLRSILGISDSIELASVAARLGVEEISLRMSVDIESPFPTVDVLTAVVKRYGLDPGYLLTGIYNTETHRRALGDPDSIADAIRHAAGPFPTGTIATPPDEPTRLHSA